MSFVVFAAITLNSVFRKTIRILNSVQYKKEIIFHFYLTFLAIASKTPAHYLRMFSWFSIFVGIQPLISLQSCPKFLRSFATNFVEFLDLLFVSVLTTQTSWPTVCSASACLSHFTSGLAALFFLM
jgi:hypothetical protein